MEFLSFEGRIEPMVWGRSTYTVLPVPQAIAEALEAQNATRVEGEINDHPINLALSRAPAIEGVFLWTGKSLVDRIGIAPGDVLEVRLRKADAGRVDTPPDVTAALCAAGRTDDWNALTPGRRRNMLHQVETAKRQETRQKRIAALVAELT